MKLKITKSIGLCVFLCFTRLNTIKPLREIKVTNSGHLCVYKVVPISQATQVGAKSSNKALKLGASLSILATLCYIGYNNQTKPKK
ncbi:MAG: hypothetical protein P4L31_07920 [Candidatus Babeliales bacterium]|nr:hypothetical protein [Candidatus Babeliales bacterium]